MKPRPVNKIAAEIDTLIRDLSKTKTPNWVRHVRPYIDAMLQMSSFSEFYGVDAGDDIGLRFLSNAAPWRGEDARRLKDEVRKALKEAQNASN